MKPYFITCKEAMEARLLLQVRESNRGPWTSSKHGAGGQLDWGFYFSRWKRA